MLALGPGLLAQDSAPAARLGRPAATLGQPTIRAQGPDVTSAVGVSVYPKPLTGPAMPTSPIVSAPARLPMPTAARAPGPVVTIPPGGPTPGPTATGPLLPAPSSPSTFASSPIPTGPIIADPLAGGCPTGGCPTPCPTNTSSWYTSVEGLFWYVKSFGTPPLITVGPAGSGAFLGTEGTFVPAGAKTIDTNPRYGFRLTLGHWFSPCWAVEMSGFYMRPSADSFFVSSDQYPDRDLARPFLSANTGLESSEIVGRPSIAAGFIRIESDSEFSGLELNLRNRWWDDGSSRLDVLVGLRTLRLDEGLRIEERSRSLLTTGPLVGIERFVFDEFATSNRFYGVQVGATYEQVYGPWTFSLYGKVGVGVTRSITAIRGGTAVITGGAPPDLPGGLLALNSNIGDHASTRFTVVPEVGLNIGYDVSDSLRVFAGYSFLYWSSVARPGAQIDRTLDVNRIPDFPPAPAIPGVRPAPLRESESFWATGVNFGLLWRW
jgi:hypothetical protein